MFTNREFVALGTQQQQNIFRRAKPAWVGDVLAITPHWRCQSHNYRINSWWDHVMNPGGSFVALAYSALQGNTLSTT